MVPWPVGWVESLPAPSGGWLTSRERRAEASAWATNHIPDGILPHVIETLISAFYQRKLRLLFLVTRR